ncbi:BNR repeat-containing protein [Crenothrix polyspora]|uniref:BNR repeat-containing protein n=1 Tax=Crenothrix polyspora TaxID=360316 RepID=A0A1R4HIY8_9GAMM|nr:sialidase family protein [Crenothrix polyspora]SJM96204.1 BNR repeat-containing protein [Crenothrix polyspora]
MTTETFKQRVLSRAILAATVSVLSACSDMTALTRLESTADSAINSNVSKTVLSFSETTSFDVYVDNNRIHLIAAGMSLNADKQAVIRHVYSDDNGKHWSEPSNVLIPKPPSMATRGNDIQLAVKDDKLVALWQTTGELLGMGAMVSVYSHDGGKTWQASPNPAANDSGDQSHIDIAAAKNGSFHAVWLDDRDENGYQGLRYARSENAGIHWQKSVTLDDTTCSCCWNKLAFTPTGTINVLYRDMEVRDMAVSQSTDNGTTWQKLSRAGDFNWKFEGCPHVGGGLAYGNINGNTVMHSVVWTGAEHKQGLYYVRSVDNGKLWSPPYKLGKMAVHGDVAVTGDKHIRVVWDETGAEGSRVFSAQSDDGGLSWSVAKQWSLPNHNAVQPRIVPAQNGFLLLWTEKQAKQASQLMTVWVE